MTTDAIFEKYAEALFAIGQEDGQLQGQAVVLALRLAIGDGVTVGRTIAGHEAAALGEKLERRQSMLLDLQAALDAALADAAAVREERDSLRQQITQMDADEGALRLEITALQREVDRLTLENGIAVDTFNSLAETHVNGNGVDPTPAALSANAWSRNHPAWEGLPKADLDVIDQLNGGLTTFRRLSATLRRDLIGRVLRHLATDGYLRQHDYETQKPGWMATATAIARYAPDYQWQTLLAEVMAEPA